MLRSSCLGAAASDGCPQYAVVVHGDGDVEYYGGADVATTGVRSLSADALDLADLLRVIDATDFFDFDEASHRTSCGPATVPSHHEATGEWTVPLRTCTTTMCVDTPHAIIRVRRGAHVHQVDDDHCVLSPNLLELEHVIDRAAGTARLVQRPIPDQ